MVILYEIDKLFIQLEPKRVNYLSLDLSVCTSNCYTKCVNPVTISFGLFEEISLIMTCTLILNSNSNSKWYLVSKKEFFRES